MKVISRGTIETHKAACEGCDSILEYTKRDVKRNFKKRKGKIGKKYIAPNPFEEYKEHYYIYCPVCGDRIEVDDID